MSSVRITISPQRSSVQYSELLELGQFRCRIRIKSDDFDFQSHAVAEVWSEQTLSWNEAARIPYTRMKTPHGLPYRKPLHVAETFKADRDALEEQLRWVLKV